MENFRKSVINSFRRVREDILKLEIHLDKLAIRQEEFANMLLDNRENDLKLKKQVQKNSKGVVCKKEAYVASTSGKKFHIPECPFAKNIRPKSVVKFNKKEEALNKGYKPCSCVTKLQ